MNNASLPREPDFEEIFKQINVYLGDDERRAAAAGSDKASTIQDLARLCPRAKPARGIEFEVEGREDLPEVVLERMSNMEDQMYSGFLSELNLAWVSVDDTICLWLPAPQDGLRPPPCSKTCKDYVLAVALVKPDPNKEYDCDGMPQYFLAVALRECVQFFKLEVSGTEICVLDTTIEISVDSDVKCMLSTPAGRLFVGCSDGCVYELHYEEDDVSFSSFWRPRKFRKTSCNSIFNFRELRRRLSSLGQFYESQPVIDMCYDPSRHYLYALTAKNSERTTKEHVAHNTSIYMFSLTTKDGKGDGTSSPGLLFADTLHNTLSSLGLDRMNTFDVLDKGLLPDRSIHPVLFSEDEGTHVVLVTATGWRISLSYDVHSSRLKCSQMLQSQSEAQALSDIANKKSGSAAAHAGGSDSRRPPEPAFLCCAYRNGLFLLCSETAVHCLANKAKDPRSSTRYHVVQDIKASHFSQERQRASLDFWQIEEMTTRGAITPVDEIWGPKMRAERKNGLCGCVPSVNEQWTQHISPPRRFICIGAQEVVIIHRFQPWEKLRMLAPEYLSLSRRANQDDYFCPTESWKPDDKDQYIMSSEQACASLLLWWVRAGGSGAEAGAQAARLQGRNQLSEAENASKFFFKVAKEAESKGGMTSTKVALTGVLMALARFLRPVWDVAVFGSGAGERIGIGAEWERLAAHLHLIFDFLKKLEIELKVSSDHMRGGGEVMRGNGLGGGRGGIQQFHGVTLENVKGFVQICKQVCALMTIVTKNGADLLDLKANLVHSGALNAPQNGAGVESLSKKTFKEAVEQLGKHNSHSNIRAHFRHVLDRIIEQGDAADHSAWMHGGFREGFEGAGAARDILHTETRDRLIHDIEEHCTNIWKPAEMSKMRAHKALVYAREALQFSDRTRMMLHVREAKKMYDRVSRHLQCDDDIDDVKSMIQGFSMLQEHLAALQVLLKRCSENVSQDPPQLHEKVANHLHDLIITISQLPDSSCLTEALTLCLEHRGLYIATHIYKVDNRQKTEIHVPVPVIDYVLRAVVRSADHMSLWPTLRKMPLLRASSDAQQRLVEFLKSNREMDKLVDFYIEIAQFGRAQEVCEQEANKKYAHAGYEGYQNQEGPSLDDRIRWFRQAANAALLGGRTHKQQDLNVLADLCDVQKRLISAIRAQTEGAPVHSNSSLSGEQSPLSREALSPQELFNKAIKSECWEIALEVMEVLHGAGVNQPDAASVVGRLWKLRLDKAWKMRRDDAQWAGVELTLTDVGRRYEDKPDFLPLHEIIEWLETTAEKQAADRAASLAADQAAQIRVTQEQYEKIKEIVDTILTNMDVDMLKIIRVYTQLHEDSRALTNRQDNYFKALVHHYKTYLDHAIRADGSLPLPLAALETDLNRLGIRNRHQKFADDLNQVRDKLRQLRSQRRNTFI